MITPNVSVITHALLVPLAPIKSTVIASSISSTTQMVTDVVLSGKLISPPSASHTGGVPHASPASFVTVIGLERTKHPSKSAALDPISAPVRSDSNPRCHMRQMSKG